ncbi:MAG: hypothetical protein ACK5OX_15665 [Desertimonas sp.]
MTWTRRVMVAASVLVASVGARAGVAAADPPGPTDYRTTVEDVSPAQPGLTVGIVGGDSFVELSVTEPIEVVVVGYRGEDYLRFDPDGTVWENRASPSYFTSRSRYGDEVPVGVVASSPPEWSQVAGDGSYAWHDHRAHWMNSFRPPGRQPGDVILEGSIPLRVDGRDARIVVASTWLAAPSPLPVWLGAIAGLGAALGAFRGRHGRTLGSTAVVTAVVALAIGWWRWSAVPPETGPSVLLIALPAVAAVTAAVGTWAVGRFWSSGLVLAAGLELALWAWTLRAGLVRAIVPTEAPAWLERAGVAAVGVAAPSLSMVALGVLLTSPAGTRRPAMAT